MVVDSSALLSILLNEDDRERYAQALDSDEDRFMSTATFVEASIVIEKRRGSEGLFALDQLITRSSIELIPVDVGQAYRARSAYRLYGKGRHPAALNLGDCFAYALASTLKEPLLFKGNDFSRTDLDIVAI
ncbi:MAG: type II toxin-antitoxin system VapC family toxin [Gammaproteobacteria bacterium]|nr:type II toxin-antitoxin system VapC family toxin [Gammaproteobacteria bacterium]